MYKTFYSLIAIIWVLDILNVPGMAFLDTTLPINFFAWILIAIFLPAAYD